MSAARNPFRGYRPAKPASFDASGKNRRSMIAKIKIATKELMLSDDDYRAILLRVTGHLSSTACSDAQLVQLLDEFKAKGFQPQPRRAPSRAADHPAAMKARALWISLWHLGAILNSSEQALEAFAKRQLGCERLQWADQGQMFKLVEALKAMAERHGWSQSTKGAANGSHALKLLKMHLCDAILTKLKAEGFAAESWNLAGAALRIAGLEKARSGGPMSWELGDLDMIAKCFGSLLRTGQRSES